jgi:hypothetical protein
MSTKSPEKAVKKEEVKDQLVVVDLDNNKQEDTNVSILSSPQIITDNMETPRSEHHMENLT